MIQWWSYNIHDVKWQGIYAKEYEGDFHKKEFIQTKCIIEHERTTVVG